MSYNQSDLIPNSFPLPNIYIDEIMKYLSGSETKVLFFVMRKTFGWQKERDRISLTQFEKGTGLSRQSIINSLESLVQLQILSKDIQKAGNTYGLNITWEKVEGSLKNRPVYKLDYDSLKIRPIDSLKIRHTKDNIKTTNIKTNNKESKNDSLPDSRIGLFQTAWINEHPNKEYIVTNWGKWGKQIKTLIKSFEKLYNSEGFDKLVECRKRYFASNEKWYIEKGFSFDIFMSNINSFLMKKNGIKQKSGFEKNLEELGIDPKSIRMEI